MNILRRIWRNGHDDHEDQRRPGDGGDASTPGLEAWIEVWRAGTEQARRRTAQLRVGISYGASENERFDLYLPTDRPRNLPFAVFVHGGEWRRSMRADSGYPAKAVHRHGAAFVAIGFDTVPAVDLDGQVDQVRRAWRYLLDNAAGLGLDPARGHLLGHGSGAQLAALAAFDPQSPSPVSAVLLSGVYDLGPTRRSARHEYLGLGAEIAARLSPIRCIPAGGPALVVARGDREPDELRRQSQNFARACKSRGLRVVQGELAGRDELGTSLELANPHSEVFATLRARG